uniref:NB-ARC domain-containing protein n=1 Tax=Fagus sylvatica TaxID=28930 RepID=A0A2N9G3Y2_FAGSY
MLSFPLEDFSIYHQTETKTCDCLVRFKISTKISRHSKREVKVFGFKSLEQGGPSYDTRRDPWHDPRMASLYIEEADVVGIESPKAELIKRLVEGPSNRMVISVVGIGGLGKTTLVKKVYDNEQVAPHFDCCAWITVVSIIQDGGDIEEHDKRFLQGKEGVSSQGKLTQWKRDS